jgi:hypothetical protein
MFTQQEIDKFWSRVTKTNSCWEYNGYRDRDGYGIIYINKNNKVKLLGAHRFSVLLHGRDIPQGYVVMHHCDNPSCVNPAHLKPATVQENNKDKQNKGRSKNGSRPLPGTANGNAKLSEKDVITIRTTYQGIHGQLSQIARQYKVTPALIHDIVKRKAWKHI